MTVTTLITQYLEDTGLEGEKLYIAGEWFDSFLHYVISLITDSYGGNRTYGSRMEQ